MIKAIIFDCFGVLTKDWWREFCTSVPPGPSLDKAKELNHQYDAGLISLEDFAAGVHKATGYDLKRIEDIFRAPKPVKNTELLEFIRSLRLKGFKIGLLSNVGTDWVTRHFLTTAEQKLFDVFVLSYKVNTTKPHPKIYQIAANKLRAETTECVFVDDIESYCGAAKAVGMQAIWYRDNGQFVRELEPMLVASSDN